jgi:hypothetical protein
MDVNDKGKAEANSQHSAVSDQQAPAAAVKRKSP